MSDNEWLNVPDWFGIKRAIAEKPSVLYRSRAEVTERYIPGSGRAGELNHE